MSQKVVTAFKVQLNISNDLQMLLYVSHMQFIGDLLSMFVFGVCR